MLFYIKNMVYTYLHINWIGEPPVVSRNNKNRRWTSELIHFLMDFNECQTRPRYFVRFYRIFYRGLLGKCADWCFMFALTDLCDFNVALIYRIYVSWLWIYDGAFKTPSRTRADFLQFLQIFLWCLLSKCTVSVLYFYSDWFVWF